MVCVQDNVQWNPKVGHVGTWDPEVGHVGSAVCLILINILAASFATTWPVIIII